MCLSVLCGDMSLYLNDVSADQDRQTREKVANLFKEFSGAQNKRL